ncbi:CPCC family cysteine-rich protein [Desulfoscipio sp. XC116]|uniref:CPCC family cysteine-rich protein n=1 Tax=Desulfoscipio sp. XC116 TaxID=3144975 RepID=UPI00325B7652
MLLFIRRKRKTEVAGNAPCPCCGFITIPNGGDALAYICPVCFWEIDLFIQSEKEPSDQNHGLSLSQARKNYVKYGSVMPELKVYCRSPKETEFPRK